MSNELTPISFSDGEFELTFHPDAARGFRIPAGMVASSLGFAKPADLLRSIPDDEKGCEIARTLGGDQRIWHLTLPGFFRALGQRQAARIKDDKIRAKVQRFQEWNFGTVLPSIATTGRYEHADAPGTEVGIPRQRTDAGTLDRRALALMVIEAEDAREAAEAKVAELAPRADAWDDLASGDGDYLVGDAAKVLSRVDGISTGQNRLYAYLGERRWIYRANGTTGPWRAYQSAVDAGWLTERLSTGFHTRDGGPVANPPQVRITVKGLERLRSLMRVTGTSVAVRA